jgi:uncharacterized protein (TIGR03083 family)
MQYGLSGLVPNAVLTQARCADVVRSGSQEMVDCVGADPAAAVRRYPGWNLADLVVHTGDIHRWVEQIVRNHLSQPPEAEEDLPDRTNLSSLVAWFRAGADVLASTLERADPHEPVWTFASDGTVGFWLRRMALETATHAWDSATALAGLSARDRPQFDRDIALNGLDESLALHLPSDDTGIGGSGQRVRCICGEQDELRFQLVVETDHIRATAHDESGSVDTVVRASTVDLWLLITGRDFWSHYDVEGSETAFRALRNAFRRAPVPARP